MLRRRLLGALLLVGLVTAIVIETAAQGTAEDPAGPRLAVSVVRAGSTRGEELLTIGPGGEAPRLVYRAGTLVGRPDLAHPNWNAAGTELAFYGPGDETPAVSVVRADGSGARLLKSSEHPGGPDNASLSEPLFDRKTGGVLVAVAHTPEGEGSSVTRTPRARPGRSASSSGNCRPTARRLADSPVAPSAASSR